MVVMDDVMVANDWSERASWPEFLRGGFYGARHKSQIPTSIFPKVARFIAPCTSEEPLWLR
jgi:hypothetical protein